MQCEKCGGDCYDNRRDKRSSRTPDFKCKDRECGWAKWLEKPGQARGNGAGAAPVRVSLGEMSARYAKLYGVMARALAAEEGIPEKLRPNSGDVQSAAATVWIEAMKRERGEGGGTATKARPAARPAPAPKPQPKPIDTTAEDFPQSMEEDDSDLPF